MDDFASLSPDPYYLTAMLESLDSGFTAVNSTGSFTYWNRATTRILGKGPAAQLAPQDWPAHYGLHCPIERRLLHYQELPLVEALEQQRPCEREMILINETCPQGRWLKVLARPIYGSQGELLGGVAVTQDVTREKASLLASQMMSWFFSASDDAILGVNLDSTVLLWNPGAERMFGWSADEMIGNSIHRLIEPERIPEIEKLIHRARNNQDIPPAEADLIHKDGHRILTSRSITPIRNSQGEPIGAVVVVRDISQLKLAERQLEASHQQIRQLSTRQQQLLEQQLLGVARELHDEFGQELAAMKFELAWLERHLQVEPRIEERLESLNQLLDSTIRGLRRVSRQMRPPLLEELGLCHALDDLLASYSQRFEFQTRFDCNARLLPFNPDAALAIYRIIQEALTNVARHAQARQVAVSLALEGQDLRVHILDDGQGLPESPGQNGEHFGILGMKERARSWSGSLEVSSQPEGGTRVEARFPLGAILLTPLE